MIQNYQTKTFQVELETNKKKIFSWFNKNIQLLLVKLASYFYHRMKIPAIKKAIETYSLQQLKEAEESLLDEQEAAINIEGEDEGEQLTHTLAAIWILNEMQHQNIDFNTALRQYTSRVRSSIS